jgi:hypothetical protein
MAADSRNTPAWNASGSASTRRRRVQRDSADDFAQRVYQAGTRQGKRQGAPPDSPAWGGDDDSVLSAIAANGGDTSAFTAMSDGLQDVESSAVRSLAGSRSRRAARLPGGGGPGAGNHPTLSPAIYPRGSSAAATAAAEDAAAAFAHTMAKAGGGFHRSRSRSPSPVSVTDSLIGERSPGAMERHLARAAKGRELSAEPRALDWNRSPPTERCSPERGSDQWSPPRAISPLQAARAAALSRGDSLSGNSSYNSHSRILSASSPPSRSSRHGGRLARAAAAAGGGGGGGGGGGSGSPPTRGEMIARMEAGLHKDVKARDPAAPRRQRAEGVLRAN